MMKLQNIVNYYTIKNKSTTKNVFVKNKFINSSFYIIYKCVAQFILHNFDEN